MGSWSVTSNKWVLGVTKGSPLGFFPYSLQGLHRRTRIVFQEFHLEDGWLSTLPSSHLTTICTQFGDIGLDSRGVTKVVGCVGLDL